MAETHFSQEDNSIKSSIPIVSPCIICGQLVEVKAEIEDFDEEGDVPKNDLHRGHLSLEKDGNTDQLLQFFFKVFRVQPEEDWRTWRWDESGEDRKSPFCYLCQQRLEILKEVEKKLEELKVQLENGREELMDAMERSEEFLGRIGIYKQDNIYLRIRKQVLGSKSKAVHNKNTDSDSFENVGKDCKTRRTSSIRSTAKKAKEKLALSTESDPLFPLSSADMECAKGNARNRVHVVENHGKTEECDNSPCSIRDQNDFDVEMETSSNMSSDPEYQTMVRLSKNKIKMKGKQSARKADRSSTKKFKSNDMTKQQNTRLKQSRSQNLHTETTELNMDKVAECDTSSSSKAPVFVPVGEDSNEKSKRTKLKDDTHYKPADEEDHNLPESGDDLDSDYDESNKEGKRRPFRHYKCDIDEATGNYTVEGITIIKLPNNELGQYQYECSKCSYLITIRRRSKRNVKDHLQIHFSKTHAGRHKCKECGKEFRQNATLMRHFESIHQNRLFPCPICGKPFTLAKTLKNHKLTHLSAEERQQLGNVSRKKPETWFKFQCEDCGFRSSTRKHLEAHQLRRHGTEEEKANANKMSLCPECGKYIIEYNLNAHMKRAHASSDIRSYPCLLCEKRFKTAKGLKSHKNSMVHRREGPFQCPMCPKSFVRKSFLDKHVNNHLNIKPFTCKHCPSTFVRKGQLKYHCRTYHNEGSNAKRKRPTSVKVKGLPKKCLNNTTEPVLETCTDSPGELKPSNQEQFYCT